jgi:hypothetical protein
MAMESTQNELEKERNIARDKALDSLGRYKFMQFGYWAAIWVHLNRLCLYQMPNPFKEIVNTAKDIIKKGKR